MANNKRTFAFVEDEKNKIEHDEIDTKRRKIGSSDNQMAVNCNQQNEDPFESIRSAVEFMLIWIYNVPEAVIQLILEFNTCSIWYRNDWSESLCFKRVYEEIDAEVEYVYHELERVFLQTTNSEIWCKGCNEHHDVGLNNDGTVCNFVLNEYFRKRKIKIKKIWMYGKFFKMFEDERGKIYASGHQKLHQIAFPNNSCNIVEPELIEGIENLQQICGGLYHCVILDRNGIVFSSKMYALRQFDENVSDCIDLSKKYGLHQIKGTSSNATNFTQETNNFQPIYCFQNVKITAISVGVGHSLFVAENGEVWSCGLNKHCQLGHGNNNRCSDYPQKIQFLVENNIKIKKCASGDDHNLLLDVHGNVYGFGSNYVGQCGLGIRHGIVNLPTMIKMDEQFDDIQCGYAHSYMKSVSDIHVLFGCNRYGQCNLATKRYPNYISKPLAINEIVKEKVIGEFIKIKDFSIIANYTIINILEME